MRQGLGRKPRGVAMLRDLPAEVGVFAVEAVEKILGETADRLEGLLQVEDVAGLVELIII
jgi:hypothetical protein